MQSSSGVNLVNYNDVIIFQNDENRHFSYYFASPLGRASQSSNYFQDKFKYSNQATSRAFLSLGRLWGILGLQPPDKAPMLVVCWWSVQ